MSTRISLATGGTIVVPESRDEVKRLLSLESNAPPVTFHPTAAYDPSTDEIDYDPEPIALRIEHVTMLADATVRTTRPALGAAMRRLTRRLH